MSSLHCGLAASCGLALLVFACAEAPAPKPVQPVQSIQPGSPPPPGTPTQGNIETPKDAPGACPSSQPTVGQPCSVQFSKKTVGKYCEYGDQLQPSCRDRFVCNEGKWTDPFGPKGSRCNDPLVACPSDATHMASCSKATLDPCRKGKALCGCRMCKAPSHVVLQWRCQEQPAAPCPPAAPHNGTACSVAESVLCEYGARGTGFEWQNRCVGGKWDMVPMNVDICTVE